MSVASRSLVALPPAEVSFENDAALPVSSQSAPPSSRVSWCWWFFAGHWRTCWWHAWTSSFFTGDKAFLGDMGVYSRVDGSRVRRLHAMGVSPSLSDVLTHMNFVSQWTNFCSSLSPVSPGWEQFMTHCWRSRFDWESHWPGRSGWLSGCSSSRILVPKRRASFPWTDANQKPDLWHCRWCARRQGWSWRRCKRPTHQAQVRQWLVAGLEAARKTMILLKLTVTEMVTTIATARFDVETVWSTRTLFLQCGPSGAWTSSALSAIITARMRTVWSMLLSLSIETGSRRQNWSSTKLLTRTKCVMRLCSLMPHSHPPRQLVWESLHLPEGEEGSWCCGLDCGRGKGDEVWEAVQSSTFFWTEQEAERWAAPHKGRREGRNTKNHPFEWCCFHPSSFWLMWPSPLLGG